MLAGAAADDDAVDGDARIGLCVDDLPQPVADAAEAGDVESNETTDIALHAETCNDGAGMRIGEGRAISEKFGNDMQTRGKRDGAGRTASLFGGHVGQQHRK